MTISLFVRSYDKDFEWLAYSVKSMRKNLIGVDDRILVVPTTTTNIPVDIRSFFDRVETSIETHPGYIAQQIDKIRAYKYCKHPNILFSDSDCIYYKPFDACKCLTEEGRAIVYKTLYTMIHRDARVWQNITYKVIGIKPKWEYMRAFPILHKAAVCEFLDTLPSYNKYLKEVTGHNLSEFNALGLLAENIYPYLYEFIDTSTCPKMQVAKQYWSWGGITDEIRKELDASF